ncbi:MAG: hypothetical protein HYT37_03965 [Candidatus Sungbacteria bacterium]|nr:hypothetical protein [Candidatus Sungbacteria bacterium]
MLFFDYRRVCEFIIIRIKRLLRRVFLAIAQTLVKIFSNKYILPYATLLSYAHPALAYSIRIENPLNASDLPTLIEHLSTALMKLAIPFAVAALIWAGFKFVAASASGNEAKLKDARVMLQWIIIGTAIIVGGAALVYAAVNFAKTLG